MSPNESDDDKIVRIEERRAQRELDREIFERIFVDSPFPVQIIDDSGNVRRQNDAQLAFTGAFGGSVGIGDFNVLSDPRSERSGHAKRFKRAYAGEVVDYEFFVETADDGGTDNLWFDRLLVPIAAADASITAVVSVIMDVTERKRMEEERARLNEQLLHAQKLESLGVLAGGIAHDFNNLLVAVLGNASLLVSRLPADSPLLEYAQGIEGAARRAADVAHQMLAYSGKGRFVTELVDLTSLLEETAELLRIGVSRRVTLIRELRRDLPRVKADPTQLRQVVMNLLTNASEAYGDDAGHVVLRTGSIDVDKEYLSECVGGVEATPGPHVYVEVTDHGVGMDPATLDKIFDPFFTTKFTGRGLGLAAVFGIVRGHRGAIQVESQSGRGTTFRVLFPAEARTIQTVSSSPSRRSLPDGVGGAAGAALVVDDERAVRRIAKRMLEALGFQVIEMADAEAALELLKERRGEIEFVMLDVTMPRMDGHSALNAFREHGIDVPVMLMSGYEVDAAEPSTGKGKVALLQKPFSYDELATVLADLLS